MKFIKFVLSTKKEWTFPEDLARHIILSDKQIYPIIEDDGKFHGRTINKAHIVETDFDYEAEKRWNESEIEKTIKLECPKEIAEKEREVVVKKLEEMKKNLKIKKIIK
ncbi:MAG TPA: hypothetical protein DDY21_00100 [Candidatus Moranbacteria bacterium]|nr:hypothetical protein [Candidatus Moranbacteria bacterium]